MPYTQTRRQPWQEVAGMDGEKLFAFGGRVYSQVSNSAHAAGNVTLNSASVPANTIWVVTHAAWIDTATTIALSLTQAFSGGLAIAMREFLNPPAGFWETWDGELYLLAGDNVQAFFQGTALNDPLFFGIWGYSMVIA